MIAMLPRINFQSIIFFLNPFLHLVLSVSEWLYLLQHRSYHVGFYLVLAHVGVLGNEKGDTLAKGAATRVAPSSPIPFYGCTGPYPDGTHVSHP